MTRNELLSQAVDQCLKELYEYAVPKITWEKFVEENKLYNKVYKEWEQYNNAYLYKEEYPEKWESLRKQYEALEWENKSMIECIGPKPFEFYYLPKDIMEDICNSYIDVYKLNSQQELLDIIEILKNYCKEPVVNRYIEGENGHPGYRSYYNPHNLEEVINEYLDLKFPLMDPERAEDAEDFDNKLKKASKDLQNKFFEFLDMAGNFYNWTRDLNCFNSSVYLGPSPSSNKEAVIENWKKYRNKDIEINEEQIIWKYGKDYFDE